MSNTNNPNIIGIGISISNIANIAKQIDFEEVSGQPNQETEDIQFVLYGFIPYEEFKDEMNFPVEHEDIKINKAKGEWYTIHSISEKNPPKDCIHPDLPLLELADELEAKLHIFSSNNMRLKRVAKDGITEDPITTGDIDDTQTSLINDLIETTIPTAND